MRPLLALAILALVAGCGRTRQEPTMDHPQHSPEALSLARITPREPGIAFELLSTAIETDGTIGGPLDAGNIVNWDIVAQCAVYISCAGSNFELTGGAGGQLHDRHNRNRTNGNSNRTPV